MAYDLTLFEDRRFYLKIIESILCLTGLVLLEFTPRFFDKWVFEILLIDLGGYLLISLVLLLVITLDYVSIFTEVMFAASGCVINMVGGIFTLIRHLQRHRLANWFYIMYFWKDGGNAVELALSMTTLVLAFIFSVDFFLNMKEGLTISPGDSFDDIES